jgi:hypothetical protein
MWRSRLYLVYFLEPYFSINFHFLNNDKSYNRDLFTIYTIDDGLYVDGIKSIVLLDNISSVLHTIWVAAYIRATQSVYGLSQISALELIETSLIWKSNSKCIESRFQNFVELSFSAENFSTIFCYCMKNLCSGAHDIFNMLLL